MRNTDYKTEASERWGSTDAYAEHTEKTKNYTKETWQSVTEGMNDIFARFAECRNGGASAAAEEAQSLVRSLRDFITEYFYTCTDEILAGLGQMYVCDERFKTNIDKHGDGTAEFVCHAIAAFGKG